MLKKSFVYDVKDAQNSCRNFEKLQRIVQQLFILSNFTRVIGEREIIFYAFKKITLIENFEYFIWKFSSGKCHFAQRLRFHPRLPVITTRRKIDI